MAKRRHIPWNKGLKGFGDEWRHKTPWSKGHKLSKKQRKKISENTSKALKEKYQKDPEYRKRLIEHCRRIAKLGGQKVREQRRNNKEWREFLKKIATLGGKSVDIRKYHWKNKYKSFYDVLKISKEEWMRRVAKSNALHPSTPEIQLKNILDICFPNEFTYTGDGKAGIVIGNMIPDFYSDSKKKVIEVFGDYWHSGENPINRISNYKKFGFDCLVIWEHELKNKKKVIEEVRKFVGDSISCIDRVSSPAN